MRFVRKLDNILRDLIPLEERGKARRFLHSTEDANKLSGLVEDIRGAVLDYQVHHQNFSPTSTSPFLTSASDIIAKGHLQRVLPDDRESCTLTVRPLVICE